MIKVFLLFLLLTGCNSQTETATRELETAPTSSATSDNLKVLDEKNSLVYINDKTLNAIQLTDGSTFQLTQIPEELASNLADLDTYQLTNDGNYVVWHVPGIGIASYDLSSDEAKMVYEAGSYFQSNPNLYVGSSGLWFVDADGLEINVFDLSTGDMTAYPLDEEFGAFLELSPQEAFGIITAGFRNPAIEQVEYLIYDFASQTSSILATNSELPDRYSYEFLNDTTIVVIEDLTTLVSYDLNNKESQEFMSFDGAARLTEVHMVDGYLYILSADETLYVVDVSSKEKVKILPLEVVLDGMETYTFHPLSRTEFLVEELVTSSEEQYRRLWKSDLLGIKELLVPRFGTVVRIDPETS